MGGAAGAALKSGAETVTYEELDRNSSRLAKHLISLGVGPETIVGICLERSVEAVISSLAVFKARGAYLPLDPSYPRERLALMLGDAQPRVVITRRDRADQLPKGSWTVVSVDEVPSPDRETSLPAESASPEDLAYVIYTSGSTGEPKGVEVTQGNLMNLISWHQAAFDVTAIDRATLLASVGFDASVWETWPYLTAGASLYLPDEETRVSPERLRDWLIAEGISISFLPTVLAEQLMSIQWPAQTPLRCLLTGADTLHRFPPATLPFAIINNYGPTECTVVSTSGTVTPEVSRETLPTIGRPITNTSAYVLDEK